MEQDKTMRWDSTLRNETTQMGWDPRHKNGTTHGNGMNYNMKHTGMGPDT